MNGYFNQLTYLVARRGYQHAHRMIVRFGISWLAINNQMHVATIRVVTDRYEQHF